MKKQSDRVRDWRDRQKAEGKTSITVLLSPEARGILAEKKEQTGESYSVIVEKAIQTLKKQSSRLPGSKHVRREDAVARVSARHDQSPVISAPGQESRHEPKLLIDDLANYPSLKDIELEQALKREKGLYDFQMKKGVFKRLFRTPNGSLGRRKKWFQ